MKGEAVEGRLNIQPKDTRHNDTQHKGLKSDIQLNNTQHNSTLP